MYRLVSTELRGKHHVTNLQHGSTSPKKFDETGHDTTLNDFLNRWVPLLGQQFAELRGCIQLAIRITGEHATNHFLCKLQVYSGHGHEVDEIGRTGGSQLLVVASSSDSTEAEGRKLRLFAIFSSRFCLLISTCCSSLRRLRSSCFKPPLFL